ncbi:uncharacterized protein LOC114245915 isoform X2 [Bombyx mandarina]|uniref:Uncharacterized protein LOC114245915 isoform X2 n=1 Tax=Bombyx mandarina TaxID=7092 RepID=A0A6J2JW26_BOMMA|nr:uncharacterized protein LOC114245915 isoform X2 [Bombyx mandarina]
MEYKVNLIFLVVFSSKIVVSIPYNEENVRQRAYPAINWPSNLQARENQNFAPPQNFHAPVYQKPYYQEMAQRRINSPNEEFRAPPLAALPKASETPTGYRVTGTRNDQNYYQNNGQNGLRQFQQINVPPVRQNPVIEQTYFQPIREPLTSVSQNGNPQGQYPRSVLPNYYNQQPLPRLQASQFRSNYMNVPNAEVQRPWVQNMRGAYDNKTQYLSNEPSVNPKEIARSTIEFTQNKYQSPMEHLPRIVNGNLATNSQMNAGYIPGDNRLPEMRNRLATGTNTNLDTNHKTFMIDNPRGNVELVGNLRPHENKNNVLVNAKDILGKTNEGESHPTFRPQVINQPQVVSSTTGTDIFLHNDVQDTVGNTVLNAKSVPYNKPLLQENAVQNPAVLDSISSYRSQPRVKSSNTKFLLRDDLQDTVPNTALNTAYTKSVPDNKPLVQETVVLNPAAVDTIPSHKEQPQVISTIQTEISRGDRLEDTAPNTAFNTKSVPYNKPLVQEEAIPSFSALDSDPSHRNQPRVTSSIADTKNMLRHELQVPNTAFNIKSVPDNRPLVQETEVLNPTVVDIIPRHKEQPQIIPTIETEISRGVRLEDTAPNTAFNMKLIPYNKPLVQEEGISSFSDLDSDPSHRNQPRVTSSIADTKNLLRHELQDEAPNTAFNIKSVPDNRPLVQETVVLNPAVVDIIPRHKEQPQVISTIETEISRGDRREDSFPNTAFNIKSVPDNRPLVQETVVLNPAVVDIIPRHKEQPQIIPTIETEISRGVRLEDTAPNNAFNTKSVPYNKPLVQEEAISSFSALDSDPSHRNQPRVTSSIADTKNLVRHELHDKAPNTAFNIKSVPDSRPLIQETVVLNPAVVDIIPRHKEQPQVISTIETEISRGDRREDSFPNTAFNTKSVPYNKPLVQEEAIPSFSALDSDLSHKNQPRATSSIADTKNLVRHELQDEASNTAFNIKSVPDNRPLVQENMGVNSATLDTIPRHREQPQVISTIETEISRGVRLEDTAPNTAFNMKSVPYNKPLVQEDPSAVDNFPQKAPHVSLFSTEAHQLNKEVMPNMRISAQDNEHDKPKSIFDESIIPVAATEKSIETSTLSTNYVTKNNSEHNSNPEDYNPSEFLRQNISFDKYKSQAKTVNLQNETTTTDTPSDTGRPVVKHHHHHSSVGREILDSVLDDNIFNQPSSPMEKSLEKATFDEPLNEPLIPNNDHLTPEPWYLNSEPLRSSNITEEDHFSNNKTKMFPEETTFTFSTVPEIKEAKDIENEKPVEVIEKKDFFVNEANWFREQSEDGATNSNVVSPLTSDEDKERENVQSTTVSSLLSPLNNKKNDTSKPSVAESYVAPTISSLHNHSTVEDNRQTESTETLTVDARNDDILDLLSSKTDNSEDQLNIILTDSTENILNEIKYIDSMNPLSENNNIANEPINLEDDQMNFDDVAILFNTDSMTTVSTESLDEDVDVFSQEAKAIDNEEIPNPFIGSDETFNIFNENNANGNNRKPFVLTLDTQDEVYPDVRERIVNPTVIQSSIKGDEEDQTITSNTKPDTLPDIFTLNDDAVANPADNNTVMFKVDADFWQKIKNGNITYDVVYLFQAHDQPVVEKETQTIIYPNGTIVQQYVEKTWKKQGVQLFQIPNR